MTFKALQDYVGRAVDDKLFQYFTPTDVKARLNAAQKETQKKLIQSNNQRYMRCVKTQTVAGQKAYALPSDFIELITLEQVWQGSGDTAKTSPITPITPNQKFQTVEQQGRPCNYYLSKNLLMLVPTPNYPIELHLEYSYLVQDMVLDNDVPDVPEEYHEYIGILAVRDCLFQDERSLAPIEKKLEYYDSLFVKVAQQRVKDVPRSVVITGDYY